MKEHFHWAVPLTDEEMKKVLLGGIVSFDTNVLLDLHRLHKAGVDELKKAIELCGGRAWLTNQVASEYIEHYEEVDNFAQNFFEACCSEFGKLEERGLEILNKFREQHPTNNKDIKDTLASLEGELKKFVTDSTDKYLRKGQALSEGTKGDEISQWVMEFFNGKTGAPFTEEERQERMDEAKKRFEARIPPGWADADKPEDRRYGDYFIWVQLQQKAGHEKKDMIFVTRDGKKDWFDDLGHGKSRASLALLKEFHATTGRRRIFIFKPARFLERFLPLVLQQADLSRANKAIKEIKKFQDYQDSLSGDAKSTRLPTVVKKAGWRKEYDSRSQSGGIDFSLRRDTRHFSLRTMRRIDYCENVAIDCRFMRAPSPTPAFIATCSLVPPRHVNIQIVAEEGEGPFRAGNYRLAYDLRAIDDGRDEGEEMPFPDEPLGW